MRILRRLTQIGALCAITMLCAVGVHALAQTQNAPTNPSGVTAPTFNAYALTLQTPLAAAYGGVGTAKAYNRLTLSTGVVTWTFAPAYANKPVCTASEESTTGHYVKITAISATAVTFTSDVTTANTDPIDALCLPAPN